MSSRSGSSWALHLVCITLSLTLSCGQLQLHGNTKDSLACYLQEAGNVKEENGLLRGQLLDIQASLAQLTTSNHARVQDAEVSNLFETSKLMRHL